MTEPIKTEQKLLTADEPKTSSLSLKTGFMLFASTAVYNQSTNAIIAHQRERSQNKGGLWPSLQINGILSCAFIIYNISQTLHQSVLGDVKLKAEKNRINLLFLCTQQCSKWSLRHMTSHSTTKAKVDSKTSG